MIFLSEYAHQNRIAHVYRNGSFYTVEIFEKLKCLGRGNWPDEDSAEQYAETWVLGAAS
jgi:hypothetical protein